jgi:protein-S-isoprenylcysteine O-methyltransferase Ste14
MSGPYKYVRHPGYSGGLVANFMVPIVLNSVWALLPSLLVGFFLVFRTAFEDRALQEELDGYSDYASHVRYRLIPGVW